MLQSIQSEESHLPAHREINLRVPIELITIIFNMARANDKPKHNTNIRIRQVWHRYLSGDHQVAQKMLPACRKGKSKIISLVFQEGSISFLFQIYTINEMVCHFIEQPRRPPAAQRLVSFHRPCAAKRLVYLRGHAHPLYS